MGRSRVTGIRLSHEIGNVLDEKEGLRRTFTHRVGRLGMSCSNLK